MHRSLLWSGTGDFKVSSDYRAPSWSWASVDGPVTYPDFRSSDLVWHAAADVEEAATTPLTKDVVTGQLIGGHLRLSGTLIKLNIRSLQERSGIGRTLSFKARMEAPLGNFRPDAIEIAFYAGEHIPADLKISPSADELKQENEIFFMPILYCRGDGESDSREVLGLALSPEDGDVGTYRKVGVITAFKYSVVKALVNMCRPRDPRYYESFDGNITYIIKIV